MAAPNTFDSSSINAWQTSGRSPHANIATCCAKNLKSRTGVLPVAALADPELPHLIHHRLHVAVVIVDRTASRLGMRLPVWTIGQLMGD